MKLAGRCRAIHVCSLLLLLLPCCFAQSPQSIPVTITLTDSTNAVLADTPVRLDPAPNIAAQKSNASGVLNLKLAPGTYRLSVLRIGLDATPQTIQVNEHTSELKIAVPTGPQCEIVAVGGHEMVDTASSPKVSPRVGPDRSLPVLVRIKVVDPTGVPIPRAQFHLNPPTPGTCAAGAVNSDGLFTLTMPAGPYDLMVSSQGFAKWKQRVEVQGAEQELTTSLRVASYSGPIVEPATK